MRTKVGLIALALFGLAAYFAFQHESTGGDTWMAACLRLALVMGAAWLALPQLRKAPTWLVASAGVSCLVLARWPKYFLLVLVVAVVAAFFKPRIAQKS